MAIIYGDKNPDKNDSLVGTAGPDAIYGLTGNDTIGGGFGDSLFGGDGDDRFLAAGGEAQFEGGAGNDTANLGDSETNDPLAFNNLIFDEDASVEIVEFRGQIAGTDTDNTFDFTGVVENNNEPYYVDYTGVISSEAIYGILLGAGEDTFLGSASSDAAFGQQGDDYLVGGAGSDELGGGEGADRLVGGAGNDFLYGDGDGDTLDGGDGDDRIYSDVFFGEVTISGGGGVDTLVTGGGKFNKYSSLDFDGLSIEKLVSINESIVENYSLPIFGTSKNNVFDVSMLLVTDAYFNMAAGDDVFVGADDGESVVGGDGDDSLTGGDGKDGLLGDKGADVLEGLLGDDELEGSAGKDVVDGGVGADLLAGGAGRDKLTGGDGEDRFLFDFALKSKDADVIKDFSSEFDTIELDRSIFETIKRGVLGKDAFVVADEAQDKQDRIIYDDKTGALWFDLDGTGDGKAIKFANVGEGLDLGRQDFEVVI